MPGANEDNIKTAIHQAFAPWRQAHRRDAWRPITEDRAGDVAASKFGGIPLLVPEESWPRCGGCQRPMQLMLQLDLSSLPESSPTRSDHGLLQLFYCVTPPSDRESCEAEIDTGFLPFSPAHLVRVIEYNGQEAHVPEPPEGFHPFPSKTVIGWEHFDDYPSPVEHDQLGVEYIYKFESGRTITTVEWPEGGVRFEQILEPSDGSGVAGTVGWAAEKDKLGGWPAWVQGVEYPDCPRCHERMEYVFQIDSEDHVPHMFGDMGCGHITRCKQHPDVLAFGWACG